MAGLLCCNSEASEQHQKLKTTGMSSRRLYDPNTNPCNCCKSDDNDNLEPNRSPKKAPKKLQRRIPIPSSKTSAFKKSSSKPGHHKYSDVDPLDISVSPTSSEKYVDQQSGSDTSPSRLHLFDLFTAPSPSEFDTLSAWEKYPSHTRDARNLSAGTSDQVIIRDFAVTSSDSNREASTEESKFGPRKPALRIRQKFMQKRSPLKPLGKRFRIGEHGHRTSIAYGGKLEYPELEMIPASKSIELEPSRPWLSTALGKRMSDISRSKKPSLGHFYDGSHLTTITETSEQSMSMKDSHHARIAASSFYSSRNSDDRIDHSLAVSLPSPTSELTGSRATFNRSFDGSNEHTSQETSRDPVMKQSRTISSSEFRRKTSGNTTQSAQSEVQPPRALPETQYAESFLHPSSFEGSKALRKAQNHRRSASGKSNLDAVVILGSCESLGSQYSIRSWWQGIPEEVQRSTRDLHTIESIRRRGQDSSEEILIEQAIKTADDVWKLV